MAHLFRCYPHSWRCCGYRHIFGEFGWREARQATAEAHRQADAAEKQVGITIDGTERQLRAYLVAKVASLSKDNEQPLVQIMVDNIGQTTALHVHIFAEMKLFPARIPDSALPSLDTTDEPEVFLQPKDSDNFPVRPRSPLTSDDIHKIVEGKTHRLYVYGRIEYIDVFDKPHTTPFAWTLSGGPVIQNIMDGAKIPDGWLPRFELVDETRSPT